MLRNSAEKENSTTTTRDDVTQSPYDDPSGEKRARIQFSLKYDARDSTLTLKVMRAVDLPVMDHMTGTSDPYVKVMLLPDKNSKLSTSIKRKNLNPRWNEIFAFEGMVMAGYILFLKMIEICMCGKTYVWTSLDHKTYNY